MSNTKALSPPVEKTADSKSEVFAGLIAICVWFALFVVGTFIATQP